MVSKQVIALQMVTGTIFRVIDNNNVKLGDSIKIVIPNTKDKTEMPK
jgi:MOSC domain-containing protein YiiM